MSMKWKFEKNDDMRVWTATLQNRNTVRLMRMDGQSSLHMAFRNHETGLPKQLSLSREAAIETARKILSVYRVNRKAGK